MDFFVYLIESPRADDLYDGRSDAPLLEQALRLHGTPCVLRVATSKDLFAKALTTGLAEAVGAQKRHPVLYISAHGSKSGFRLTDGTQITWKELHDFLVPINTAVNNALPLCMSSCEGFSASQMAMKEDGPHPFVFVVGPIGAPTWGETAIAYAAFFHVLRKKKDLRQAVSAMKAASAYDDWDVVSAEDAKKAYVRLAERQDVKEMAKRLLALATKYGLPKREP